MIITVLFYIGMVITAACAVSFSLYLFNKFVKED